MILSEQKSYDLIWKALSDPTRRTILKLLVNKDLTPTHIQGSFTITQPALSSHLRILYESGLLHKQKYGKNWFYRINNETILDIRARLDDFIRKPGFIETMRVKTKTSIKESIPRGNNQNE